MFLRLTFVLICATCSRPVDVKLAVDAATAGPAGCTWRDPVPVGQVKDPDLDELSGLAASRAHPGAFWTHNDGGHKPRLYLIGSDGGLRATWKLDKAPKTDWEDVAVGPCEPSATATCVYLGDTGDNDGNRATVHVLRWPEPNDATAADPRAPVEVAEGAWQALSLTYPDGPQNAEALVVLPDARLVVLTKRGDGQTRLWRIDPAGKWSAGGAVMQAEALGSLHLGPAGHGMQVTAADLSPDGKRLAVRALAGLWVYDGAERLSGAAIGQWSGVALPLPPEVQGEAVAWTADGALITVGEGKQSPIYRIACDP
jgi:hypothetical protein